MITIVCLPKLSTSKLGQVRLPTLPTSLGMLHASSVSEKYGRRRRTKTGSFVQYHRGLCEYGDIKMLHFIILVLT